MIDEYVLDSVTFVACEITDYECRDSCKGCVFDTEPEKCITAPQCSYIGANQDNHIIWVVKE